MTTPTEVLEAVDGNRERGIAVYRERVAQQLAYHKQRIDAGYDPRCGLRLMVPGSATVVPDTPLGCSQPFVSFSLDSRDAALYAIASAAAADLVEYARQASRRGGEA